MQACEMSKHSAPEDRTMHQVIHAIVDAQTRDDALGVAQGCVFDRLIGATANSSADFDYYVTFDEEGVSVAGKARYGELPVAARLSSDDGRELLARGWEATKAEFKQNLAKVREAFDALSNEEIMNNDDWARSYCADLGTYAGPPVYLYDEYGCGIRTFDDFARAYEDLDKPWIVPADVHY
jgi:hypothetical protein